MTLKRTLLTLCMLLLAAGFAVAQNPQPTDDPIAYLNLTPEQRQRIRILTEQTREERQLTNRRLREANVALDQALEAEPVDDNVVEQRINELAAAQAAQMRMRIHMELRIRRLLYPEQLATLKRLRLQVRDVMNPQRPNNPRRPRGDAFRPNTRRP
jgi:Spy/CpxP family protein refolding chaperone